METSSSCTLFRPLFPPNMGRVPCDMPPSRNRGDLDDYVALAKEARRRKPLFSFGEIRYILLVDIRNRWRSVGLARNHRRNTTRKTCGSGPIPGIRTATGAFVLSLVDLSHKRSGVIGTRR